VEPDPDVEPLEDDIFPTFPKITIPPEMVPIEIDLIETDMLIQPLI